MLQRHGVYSSWKSWTSPEIWDCSWNLVDAPVKFYTKQCWWHNDERCQSSSPHAHLWTLHTSPAFWYCMACHIKIFWIYLLEIGWAGFADTVKESGKYLGILWCLGSGNFGFQCGFGFRYFLLLFLHLGQFKCAERGCFMYLCCFVVSWLFWVQLFGNIRNDLCISTEKLAAAHQPCNNH